MLGICLGIARIAACEKSIEEKAYWAGKMVQFKLLIENLQVITETGLPLEAQK